MAARRAQEGVLGRWPCWPRWSSQRAAVTSTGDTVGRAGIPSRVPSLRSAIAPASIALRAGCARPGAGGEPRLGDLAQRRRLVGERQVAHRRLLRRLHTILERTAGEGGTGRRLRQADGGAAV